MSAGVWAGSVASLNHPRSGGAQKGQQISQLDLILRSESCVRVPVSHLRQSRWMCVVFARNKV